MRVLLVTQTHVTTESPLRVAGWESLDSTHDDFIFVPPPPPEPPVIIRCAHPADAVKQ